MHFYIRHLGDYAKDTANLSALEVGVYDLLLDFYYSTEKPLPLNRADLRNIARCTNRYIGSAMDKVLATFFEKTEKGYLHGRVEEELAKARSKSSKAKAAAAARWEAEKGNANASDTEGETGDREHANASGEDMRTHRSSNASQEANTKTLKPSVNSEVSGTPSRAGARRKAFASLLTASGVPCSAAHAQVVAWAIDEAVTDAVLEGALVVMRRRSPRDPKPQYLAAIVNDLIAQQSHEPRMTANGNRSPPAHATGFDERAQDRKRFALEATGRHQRNGSTGEVIDLDPDHVKEIGHDGKPRNS
jgi:uncharacterized protein YdaU (DUF1376 family)